MYIFHCFDGGQSVVFGMALLTMFVRFTSTVHVHSYNDCIYSRQEESRELSKLVIYRIEYRIIYADGQDNAINNC